MNKNIRVMMAQLNFHLGDLSGNLQKHLNAIKKAQEQETDIIIFPELSLTGYPPEDLLLRPSFIKDVELTINELKSHTKNIYCIIGHPLAKNNCLYNACSVIYNGKIIASYAKQRLPNYGVFDECRYFSAGDKSCVINIKGIPVGVIICEDLWKIEPTQDAVKQGAKLIICPNASPFESNKHEQRCLVLSKRAQHNHVPIIYVNHVCGQDELIFDGGSLVVDNTGKILQCAGFFNETLHSFEIEPKSLAIKTEKIEVPLVEKRIYQALVLGLKDYVQKNKFTDVLIGTSGGIDSALTLCIAVDALGKNHVHGILMPSRYTADISHKDADLLAKNLGIKTETVSIEPSYSAFLDSLSSKLNVDNVNITMQNIQSRCRAVLLMALSNQSGSLVLSTGNRSELATGYCTIYGDMVGAFAPLKDVTKSMVYQLARYRNTVSEVIPQSIIDRAPTAELAPNQKDEDSLPPYSILDEILELYLNQTKSIAEIVAQGFEKSLVEKIVKLIHQNEYKRRQATIGPHINHKSFIKDWRYPLTNGYKG